MKFFPVIASAIVALSLSGCSDNDTTTTVAPTTSTSVPTTAGAQGTTVSPVGSTTKASTTSASVMGSSTTGPADVSSTTISSDTTTRRHFSPTTSDSDTTTRKYSESTTLPSASPSTVSSDAPTTVPSSSTSTTSSSGSCLAIPSGKYCGKYMMFKGTATIDNGSFDLTVRPLVNINGVDYTMKGCTDFEPDYNDPQMVDMANELGMTPDQLDQALTITYDESNDTLNVSLAGFMSLGLSKDQC
ncbi:hypothetical protein FOZ60_007542 [Perkinsus olseni]|uniref:Uncharacterized protein n=1 Tax=Perkinsus olseni TaxID=32597 RepID=A0A7J6PNH5_PEROL|nr:hypothetical protein FOZ60_007542 [Perkinsus olseni]